MSPNTEPCGRVSGQLSSTRLWDPAQMPGLCAAPRRSRTLMQYLLDAALGTVLYGSTRLDARNCQFIGSSQASRSCRRRRAEMSNRRWAETCGARCRPHSHPGHGWTMEPWASLDCALAVSTSQNRPGLSPIQSSRCKAREPLTNSRERPFESVV